MVSPLRNTNTMARHEITIGGDTFEYIDAGRGAHVLFLHGALGDLRTWQEHCGTLSGPYRALAYTQRYFGSLPWRADGPAFGVITHANDLVAFVRALGLSPVRVVAWSYAGHVVLDAALREPDLFSGLLLYEPGVRTIPLEEPEESSVAQDAQAAFGPIFEAVGSGNHTEAVRKLIEVSGGNGYFDAQPPQQQAIHLENAHTMPHLLAQAPPPEVTHKALAALPMLVSIAWGAKTRPLFKVPSQALARCIPQGHHREVRGVGHLWPEADPVAFMALVEEWLQTGSV
jgi:pimeloyl-ACP methyl ester carboxylesterase